MNVRYGLPYFMDWSLHFESKPFGVESMPGHVCFRDFFLFHCCCCAGVDIDLVTHRLLLPVV